jgi:general L-amino acid transport system permease protein
VTDTAFVRSELVQPMGPPPGGVGVSGWLKKNLFSSIGSSILTVLSVLFLAWLLPALFGFLFERAVWVGTPDDCRVENVGACWAFISARGTFLIYGPYPTDQYWRVNIFFVLSLALLVPLLWPSVPFKRLNALLFFIVYPIVSFFLLHGGVFGLREIATDQWGGLLITFLLSVVGITGSFPIGVLLALGRRSKLPIVKAFCILFIELWRAVPLITVLFMASVMLPLFMPEGTNVDRLLRAMIGLTLFYSAYMAEVIRGGLQALPRGQYEAASALGLNYWKSMTFIIMPQALTLVIPGIVGNFISLLKDTSLVAIIGIFDLLNAVKAINSDAAWATPTKAVTSYIFAALLFFVLCFAISRYSIFLEKRLRVGHKR